VRLPHTLLSVGTWRNRNIRKALKKKFSLSFRHDEQLPVGGCPQHRSDTLPAAGWLTSAKNIGAAAVRSLTFHLSLASQNRATAIGRRSTDLHLIAL
jgi:hypothetical protein